MQEESAECTQSPMEQESEDKQYSRLCRAIVKQTIIDATSPSGESKAWRDEVKLRNYLSVARNAKQEAIRFLDSPEFREIHQVACWYFHPPSLNLMRRKVREFEEQGVVIRWEYGRAVIIKDGVETVVRGWEMN